MPVPDGIAISEIVLAVIVLALVLPLCGLMARRAWLARQGWVFECGLRPVTTPSSSWGLGVARIEGDNLEWYRLFSVSPKPRLVMHRTHNTVVESRATDTSERVMLSRCTRVIALKNSAGTVELAMEPTSAMAVLSWVESSAPGYYFSS